MKNHTVLRRSTMMIRITHTTPRVIISHFSSLEYQQIGELEADDFFAGIFDDYGERHQVSEVTHTNDKRHTFFFQDVSQLYKRAYPSLSPLVSFGIAFVKLNVKILFTDSV